MSYKYEHILPSVRHLKNPPRVLVAMSGGVDSSTVAYLFKEAGYDVIGVFIKMWYPEGVEWENTRDNLCCDISTVLGVKQVAAQLDIPFYVLDMAQEFKERVVDNYLEEYEQGRTPNPCSKCNKFIKLGFLWEKAQQYGAQYLATGHYVRALGAKEQLANSKEHVGSGQDTILSPIRYPLNAGLYRATDQKKDQSYFLWEIDPKVVPHLLFPLGKLKKPEVREIAREAGLPVFDKEESQGTCFIVEKNNRKFLQVYAQRLTVPGDIVDERGNVLGQHRGLVFYTIGQREGLGDEVAGKYIQKLKNQNSKIKDQIPNTNNKNTKYQIPNSNNKNTKSQIPNTNNKNTKYQIPNSKDESCALPPPYTLNPNTMDAPKLYVKRLDTERNQLVVAENRELFGTKLQAKEINILDDRLSSLVGSEVFVQIRGGHRPDQARLLALDLEQGTFELEFLEGVRAITPGQSAVIFEGDQLLGGGIIASI